MKMLKKNWKIFAAAITVALIFALPLSASADSDRVVDNLDLLTSDDEDVLETKLDTLSEELGHDIAVVTTGSLDGKNIKLYADDYYDFNGYGMGDDDSGILLVVYINAENKSDRQWAFTLYGRADDIFTESDMTALTNAFLDDLSDGYYFDAFDAYAEKCEDIIINDNKVSPVAAAFVLILGAAVGGIVVWAMCSKYKSVRSQRSANSYMRRDSFHVDRSRDVYLYSHVTRRVKPQNNGSSSSGRSTGSSGRSHGGRSGRF